MTGIKAIETRYAGCHFRSRLEARWAVFFDKAGIEWQYEPQGFEIYGGQWYLPDFYLPKSKTWVEVKGELTPQNFAKLINAMDWNAGLPDVHEQCKWGETTTQGLLLLGDIPRVDDDRLPLHSLLTHHKGVCLSGVTFWGYPPNHGQPFGVGHLTDYEYWSGDGQDSQELPKTIDLLAPGIQHNIRGRPLRLNEYARAAYVAAREARFEYGQSG